MTAITRHLPAPAAARGRLLLWVGAIVLLLQLFAALGHDHDIASKAQDCVACSVQAQSHAAPPAPQAAPATRAWVLAHIVTPGAIPAAPARPTIHLLPQPHAPPASAFAS